MKKIISLLLIISWSHKCLMSTRTSSTSNDSSSTQPWHSPQGSRTDLNDFNDVSTQPIAGVPLNSERMPLIHSITEHATVGIITPYILSPEELERQNRINHEVQISPFRRVFIPCCIILTSSWILGSTIMGIMYEIKKH